MSVTAFFARGGVRQIVRHMAGRSGRMLPGRRDEHRACRWPLRLEGVFILPQAGHAGRLPGGTGRSFPGWKSGALSGRFSRAGLAAAFLRGWSCTRAGRPAKPTLRVGAKVRCSNVRVHATATGGGAGASVSGEYEVTRYLPERPYGVHIGGLGWIRPEDCGVIG